jgi:aldehyde:ferredoxin oxidoreductase
LDEIELEWGNPRVFAELAEKISKREGIGDILAEGSYRAALKLGEMKDKDLTRYAINEKGMAIGAHGIRSCRDYTSNISYACSVQAGDHTSVAQTPTKHKNSELNTILHDSGVYCFFNTLSVDLDLIWDFFEAVTGWTNARHEWYETNGLRILQLQRAMLLLGGPDLKWRSNIDDDNPTRFYEPLPSGPYKGRVVKRERFEEEKKEYYEAAGWNEKGLPTSDTLERLGLEEVETKLKKAKIL